MLLTGTVSAKPVDAATARRVAETWMNAKGMKNTMALVDISDRTPFTEFYVFAAAEGGFVLVSAHDCVRPVLGYSASNQFEPNDIPANMRSVLDGFERAIRHWKQRRPGGCRKTAMEWKMLANGEIPPAPLTTAVAPLLSTTWGQAPYYNTLCPYDSNETVTPNHRLVTGCTAVSTAQIMKYHNYPTTGYGSHSYITEEHLYSLGADFGATTYDWSHMPNALTATSSDTEVNAVATLLFHVGVGSEMEYGYFSEGGSGAYNYYNGQMRPSAQLTLATYFKYRPDMAVLFRKGYSDEEYSSLLRAELDQNRPILYQGDGEFGSHSFVCDGYDNDGLFHFNWGWRSRGDGFFALVDMAPYDGGEFLGNYNLDNIAVTGIRPNTDWDTAGTTTVTVNATSGSNSVQRTGSYAFGDTVTLLIDSLPEGYRFARWSDWDRCNPRLMLATGGDYSFSALTERIGGDTLSYCGKLTEVSHTISVSNHDNRWGIRLPSSTLRSGTSLNAVQFLTFSPGEYTLTVYTGTDAPTTAAYTSTYTIDNLHLAQWNTLHLSAPVAIDGTENLWITFSNTDIDEPATTTTYCGNPDGALVGNDMHPLDQKYSFPIRGIFCETDTSNTKELTNLVIFVRFADEEEIDHSFEAIDSMFNSREAGYLSVYNFYDALTYGKIHYNTVYTNNIQDGIIVSYVDPMPRGYYQPYSESNPLGYTGPYPQRGIPMREAQLLARVFHYVDSLHLVSPDVVLDGDGDGYIDNVSFIIKGNTDTWRTLLWPHMEYFPHDSIPHPVTINGVQPNTFNFEFEGADERYFCAHVFRHEIGHSLHLPDLYHYYHYDEVYPAGPWDMMDGSYGPNHTNALFKNKILHVADDPIEIVCDGDYTLRSVGTSGSQNCYYIRSAIDSSQWFTFEYRNKEDLFEEYIPGTGLIAGRWNDSVPMSREGLRANELFDFHNYAHLYWIFRPGSAIDSVGGRIKEAHFSMATGRTSFGPSTDPHPYLTDGTPERSFEITDIRENGSTLTFHVHFLNTEGIEQPVSRSQCPVVSVQDGRIIVDGAEEGPIIAYDMMGRVVSTLPTGRSATQSLPSGVYVVKVGESFTRKVVVIR